jgi:hypothetical protein
MMIAQAEGRSFVSVVQEFNVINNRPALKAESMLARFQLAGGKIKWTELSDERCAAVFSHPQCEPVEIDWDMNRARQAGLGGGANWRKYPRNMLKARVISDGVRTAYPACLGGMHTPEEVGDFDEEPMAPATNATTRAIANGIQDAREGMASGEDGEIADPEQDPLWAALKAELEGNVSTRDDAALWLKAKKSNKEGDYARKHSSWRKAFYEKVYLPHEALLQ